MGILKKEDIIALGNGEYVSGYVLMGNYTKQMSKNKSPYLAGSLECLGTMQFKVWSNAVAFQVLSGAEMFGKILQIEAEVNEYGGSKSLIISYARLEDNPAVDGVPLKSEDFMSSVYDVNLYWKTLEGILSKHCSAEGIQIFNAVFNDNPSIKERFLVEFAACSHHDNVKSGLLAHTTKVTKIATILSLYPYILQRVSPDLLFLGCALHDIGKIREYTSGTVIDEGKILSHNTFGVLMLEGVRELICKLKGETFYYQLLSIVVQHHGEYGERPRTLAAQIVHMLDLLESNLTSLNTEAQETSSNDPIIYDGYRLV